MIVRFAPLFESGFRATGAEWYRTPSTLPNLFAPKARPEIALGEALAWSHLWCDSNQVPDAVYNISSPLMRSSLASQIAHQLSRLPQVI
jgi:hypothetical protein